MSQPTKILTALNALPKISQIVQEFDLAPKKALGQNFLFDLNITDKIAGLAGDLTQYDVIEIGPGPGGLTRSLLKAMVQQNAQESHLFAIDKDARTEAVLQPLQAIMQGQLHYYNLDAMRLDLDDLPAKHRIKIIANLPYNISTALVVKWLMHDVQRIESMVLMFQKEVANRLIATPHQKAYGRLSVLVQAFCDAKAVMQLPARAFTPPPKVDSTVVELKPLSSYPNSMTAQALENITAAAFGQRRKMVRQSLKGIFEDLDMALNAVNVQPTDRAENITVEQYIGLAQYSVAA